MNQSLAQYFRCPERYIPLALKGIPSVGNGYFSFGKNVICYGKYCDRVPSPIPDNGIFDALKDTAIERGTTYLPFDANQVVDSLRRELYATDSRNNVSAMQSTIAGLYYFIRPILPVEIRKYLQKVRLNDWQELQFPHWPVDRTVEKIFQQILLLSLKSQGLREIPFIWFWPNRATSCAVMTHDVETKAGRGFCSTLMDVNDEFGIKASFQVVPERRYEVPSSYLDSIRNRGFEINVQDLNHDGRLFRDREEFLRRAAKINSYGREYEAVGFRSAILYRRQEWYDALQFSYDMSVPNVAHLDPQRGGCCTVMPYFVGDMLELPVTTTQDYSLFHILNDYSIELWKQQTELIMQEHGLMNFIVHPDYIIDDRERKVYESLLTYLAQLRSEKNTWIPLPREANYWWRQRAQMNLIETAHGWQIEGDGSERACVAYAREKEGRLEFSFESKEKSEISIKIGDRHSPA
ncbi:MAG TPA: hypothetical protein VFA74_17985 [Terriglobales bacterium]|nr:hypothetical protein [Terriglobales bacterium]